MSPSPLDPERRSIRRLSLPYGEELIAKTKYMLHENLTRSLMGITGIPMRPQENYQSVFIRDKKHQEEDSVCRSLPFDKQKTLNESQSNIELDNEKADKQRNESEKQLVDSQTTGTSKNTKNKKVGKNSTKTIKLKNKRCLGHPVSCSLCKRTIENRYLLNAIGKFWHEKCLKCDFCRKPLYKLGDKFYYRQGAKFCHEDFLRTFGARGTCCVCEEQIPPTDYVLRFKGDLLYHLECFKCIFCRTRFCVGDPVTITDPKYIACVKCKFVPTDVLKQAYHKHYGDLGTNYRGFRHVNHYGDKPGSSHDGDRPSSAVSSLDSTECNIECKQEKDSLNSEAEEDVIKQETLDAFPKKRSRFPTL